MQLMDAIIAIVQADAPDKWKRYSEIAPYVDRDVPAADAPRDLLRRRLVRVSYDVAGRGGPYANESLRLEEDFLALFATAVQELRCHVLGVPDGGTTERVIPPTLITNETTDWIRGTRWERLAGKTWHSIRVVMGPPPVPDSELRQAGDDPIRKVMRVEYATCAENGHKPPNLNQIIEPVLIRLRAIGLIASGARIREIAEEDEFEAWRRKPGKTLRSERKQD
jgi:hypothetical protein